MYDIDWLPIIGAAVGAPPACLYLLWRGFVVGAPLGDGDGVVAKAGSIYLPALATLTKWRTQALFLSAWSISGGILPEALYLFDYYPRNGWSGVLYNIISIALAALVLAVEVLVVFYWHRTVLRPCADSVNFSVASPRGLLSLAFKLIIVLLIATGLVLGFIALTSTASAASLFVPLLGPGLAVSIAALAGAFGVRASVWYTRFSLTFPATSIGQPGSGIFEMHARARPIAIPLAAALLAVGLPFLPFVLFQELLVWGWWESTLVAEHGILATSAGEFLFFTALPEVLYAMYLLWSISVVSLAYKDWILTRGADRHSEGLMVDYTSG